MWLVCVCTIRCTSSLIHIWIPPATVIVLFCSRRTLSLGHKYKLNIKYLLFSFYLIFCSTSSRNREHCTYLLPVPFLHSPHKPMAAHRPVCRSKSLYPYERISFVLLQRSDSKGEEKEKPFGCNNIDAIGRSVGTKRLFFLPSTLLYQSAVDKQQYILKTNEVWVCGDRSLPHVVCASDLC